LTLWTVAVKMRVWDERGHLKETTMKTTKRTTWVAAVIAALRQAVANLLYG
jgi:hypothetical protein